jgi:isoquinoline 1-oxidoreductase subunit beta
MNAATPEIGRRHFLIGLVVVAGGAAAGTWLATRQERLIGTSIPVNAAVSGGKPFVPNAFVHIGTDDSVTVIIGKAEMGQGIFTSLAMIVAEELGVKPERVHVEFAPVDPAYNSTMFPMQFTGGSSSVRTCFEQMRKAGATARAMLVAAAAQKWQTDVSKLSVEDGVVTDGTQRARFGELATIASTLEPPKDVTLKDPKDFTVIGQSVRRLDGLDKVTGRAVFGIDVQQPDMLIAMVAHAPLFGGTVVSVNDKAAREIPGVVTIKQIPTGVAVLATNTWAARRGRDALDVQWRDVPGATVSTAAMREQYRKLATKTGTQIKAVGDAPAVIAASRGTAIDAEYEVPYLAHACMEPLNCAVHVTENKCEIWVGTQFQTVDRQVAAIITGLKPEQVELHTTFLGGGFGRRGNPKSDFLSEAVHVAKGVDKPVKLVWSREDDMRAGYYRPFFLHRVRGAFDEQGTPLAWHHTIVGQSILAGTMLEGAFGKGPDPTSHEGVADMPYAFPNFQVDQHDVKNAVPVQFWRSVGHSATGFIVNGFIDELAVAARKDPVEFRRELLKEKPRHLAVLNLAADKAGWDSAPPEGRSRGVALQESFGSIVAEVAEVSVTDGKVRVHRVVCAVDCGPVVNPDNVAAQVESGIVYGLSAALYGEITLSEGRVQQGNFNDYPVLRIEEMPRIETHIIKSIGPMGGVGEISTPCIAPAVCNAIFAATGKRIRRLPISASLAEA